MNRNNNIDLVTAIWREALIFRVRARAPSADAERIVSEAIADAMSEFTDRVDAFVDEQIHSHRARVAVERHASEPSEEGEPGHGRRPIAQWVSLMGIKTFAVILAFLYVARFFGWHF